MSNGRILGMTESEMLAEFRDYVCDGIPASGSYRPAVSLCDALFPLIGRASPSTGMLGVTRKSDVRDEVRALFAKAGTALQ